MCHGLRQREDEREKQGLCRGWRPVVGYAVIGAMGCVGGGGHWLCGSVVACVVRIK